MKVMIIFLVSKPKRGGCKKKQDKFELDWKREILISLIEGYTHANSFEYMTL